MDGLCSGRQEKRKNADKYKIGKATGPFKLAGVGARICKALGTLLSCSKAVAGHLRGVQPGRAGRELLPNGSELLPNCFRTVSGFAGRPG